LSSANGAALKDGWRDEHTAWPEARSVGETLRQHLGDGINLQERLEGRKRSIAGVIGATQEGRKEMVGFKTAPARCAADWRDLLLDLSGGGSTCRSGLQRPMER